jgi:hypothetical protein
MQQNNMRGINMAEVPKATTIQQIFDARATWRTSNIMPLSDNYIRIIDVIRTEVKSGATADGWYMAGAGKSAHGRVPTNHRSYGGGAGGAGGGSVFSKTGDQTRGGRNNYDKKQGGWQQRQPYQKSGPIAPKQDVVIKSEPVSVQSRFYNSSASFAKMAATAAPVAAPVVAPVAIPVETVKSKLEQLQETNMASGEIKKSGPPVFKQYKPRFTNSEYVQDDSPESKMLLNIQAAINKLVEDNYENLKRLLRNFLALDDKNTYLSKFMKMIFNSAIRDKVHCHLFAKLLYEMSQDYSFLQTEMNAKYDQFISTIFNKIEPVYETDTVEVRNEKNANKEMRLGYSQFITELLKYNVIEDRYFLDIISQIINTIDTQSADAKYTTSVVECAECLKTIIQTIGQDKTYESYMRIKSAIQTDYLKTIKSLSEVKRPGMMPRAQFALMDVCDLFA